MDKIESRDSSFKIIFPKGQQIQNAYFIGTVWVERLVPNDGIFNCTVSNVTFEPGARNNWHKHPGGQILLITGGKGYYQEEGRPVQLIKEGDVVKIQPDVKHWHGAAPDSWLSHIAITTNPQKGEVIWMEPVSDEYYSHLKIEEDK
ncbi:quercetin dioxygenase-like cupin family protein [Caldicoprobacter guelmensis]|uniref:(R)-mandelonitrile lyase n=1 Tax=Caldicoprobacter guelmensis TaxID=1170224 RepID=UPI00195B859F|nr:cupin domain-containing protein [Caldicoprobacter guelmensis]MBM7581926.1 quercetin dioxygenase-like cupin family protein [Caldicoprobacter guelmensis]